MQHSGVRPWYEAKKARSEDDARRVVVAVMRKLALALYHIGVKGEAVSAKAVIRAHRAAQGSRRKRGRDTESEPYPGDRTGLEDTSAERGNTMRVISGESHPGCGFRRLRAGEQGRSIAAPCTPG